MLHIFGGGTVYHVRNHLALCAPAYGSTARLLHSRFAAKCPVTLHLTKMADPASKLETNAHVATRLTSVLLAPETTGIIFNVALCDYEGHIGSVPSGKYAERLRSREGEQLLRLTPADKLLARVKASRPDVALVGFKTTAGADMDEQVDLSTRQLNESGADYVFANDTVTRANMLVSNSKQGAFVLAYGLRDDVLDALVATLAHDAKVRA